LQQVIKGGITVVRKYKKLPVRNSVVDSSISGRVSHLARLANIGLRGVTLVSKFLLIFLLARFLEPSEVGLYGLVAVTIGYSLFLLGFDFYTYTTREIIKHDKSQWGGFLKNQSSFAALLYLMFLPMLTLVFWQNLLPWYLASWFFVLVVLEHINQELGRLLVAIFRPLTASVVLFLRSGLWAVVVSLMMIIEDDARSLVTVLQAWSIGGLLAVLLGVFTLWQMKIGGWHQKVNWGWIRQGIRISLPFLMATLAIRGVYTLDRYWFEALAGLELLAAYVLFIGMCNALVSFLDSGVFAFIYPAMVRSWHEQSPENFKLQFYRLLTNTLVFTGVFVVSAIMILPYLLSWLNRPVYSDSAYLFDWILLSTALFALSMVPHYALYAQGRDWNIISSHIGAFLIFIPLSWGISQFNTILAIPVALCITFAIVLLWKSLAYMVLTPSEYQFFRQ
jgi:O-antigen/teichoic acid export membrane protein